MALLTARSYAPPHRMGKTKALEQAGDWQRLTEYLIHLSQANGDHETAAELREQLRPATSTTVDTEPAYTAPPEAKRRKRTKQRAPSTHQQRVSQAWEDLKLRRASSA